MNTADAQDSIPNSRIEVREEQLEADFDTLIPAFALFDADGDGKLTEEEVMAALTRKTGKGTELSVEAARATWQRWQKECDMDKDGKISYKELIEDPLLEDPVFDDPLTVTW